METHATHCPHSPSALWFPPGSKASAPRSPNGGGEERHHPSSFLTPRYESGDLPGRATWRGGMRPPAGFCNMKECVCVCVCVCGDLEKVDILLNLKSDWLCTYKHTDSSTSSQRLKISHVPRSFQSISRIECNAAPQVEISPPCSPR